MRLGIGLQRKAALRHRHALTHRGERVQQGLARAHMHTHITHGHHRQSS